MEKIEACEMWFIRRMGKISWKQKMRNEDVLKKMNVEKSLLNTIKSRKMKFFEQTNDSIVEEILAGEWMAADQEEA